jgi:hypothetical protein
MSEFNEFRQPSALSWKPEVSGTWLAYESQDTQRNLSTAGNKDEAVVKPVIDVTSSRPGDTLNFSKDDKGYFFFKVSGDDNYAHHYFNKAQKWAHLEVIDKNGHRTDVSYDLNLQRQNVDNWLAGQKPVEKPVNTQPQQLEITPAFKSVEQPTLVGKPLLPDQYHHWSNIIESMSCEFGDNPLSVLRMVAGLADEVGGAIDDQIGAMHDYLVSYPNSDPKMRVQLAIMEIASASNFLVARDETGKLVVSVNDNSPAGAYLKEAMDELDRAIKASDTIKDYKDYGRTNNRARDIKRVIGFVKTSLDKGFLKVLNGRPLPKLLPPAE